MKATKTKPAKRKLNVNLLRKIQKHILEEPKRFFMAAYLDQGRPGSRTSEFRDQAKRFPSCGTTACIAGWANILTGARSNEEICDSERAVSRLGIERGRRAQLFLDSDWPQPFSSNYERAMTPAKRAKIAAARIEHLIKTGE